jgi:hypothetical protein
MNVLSIPVPGVPDTSDLGLTKLQAARLRKFHRVRNLTLMYPASDAVGRRLDDQILHGDPSKLNFKSATRQLYTRRRAGLRRIEAALLQQNVKYRL